MTNELDERQRLRAAYLYYREGLTQAQVAARLGIGRATIGRMLASAVRDGIVTIDIAHPHMRLTVLETALEREFSLDQAIVAVSTGEDEREESLTLLAVARAAAEYLAGLQLSDTDIAVGWGTTLEAVAHALPEGWAERLSIWQLNGSLSVSTLNQHASDTITAFARRAKESTAHLLQVPAIMAAGSAREALESDRSVRDALDRAGRAPLAIFALGRLREDSVLVRSGYLDAVDIERLRMSGCVGDIISRFVDGEGAIVDRYLDARTMGADVRSLNGRTHSIGVASGVDREAIVRAAIRGGHINTLIVDERLASALLDRADTANPLPSAQKS